MENMLRVGVITSPHGIKGEVKVFPTTDDAKRFKELKKVILDTGKEYIPMEIEHVKFFKNMVILKFKGYDNINEIEKYKSRDLLITRDQAVDLAPDEYFITDLIGLAVVSDQGVELGTLKDVLETGANDVYVVAMKDGKELMLPAIGDCILNVDLEQRRMEVHVLEGLMDL
ncbi:ribosome maturation factor RimM [Enterocloster clostridioformis]|jgi:16S rRNA processing protein RimM|uniref:Ribosome maturation factor RimM n=4 Tax=Enterocloster clostridioformis TaxID=1531 RepID=R0C047_9FIRM|nr:ribosome maturation factor RimM [Enterocloster clostridioformis]EHG29636.1 ribosome maturation factor rimM [ [[Clostridium] clostridioforme 2_1_49FAA]ENY83903.1 16S rRNA processing protein RimM [[Clostridium] clostridioforme CM201]ENZ04339.1 16S rRNA processing protein RimM [[Clostridium] clostridioforme 90B1]ENZ17333.1 16S rRNA processing protein RimM [[Clostridium] clostridioforme 90A8]ENZ22192.1 16S rRNA processing protein RimM [[Clostridium] clostridioforme 90A3]